MRNKIYINDETITVDIAVPYSEIVLNLIGAIISFTNLSFDSDSTTLFKLCAYINKMSKEYGGYRCKSALGEFHVEMKNME